MRRRLKSCDKIRYIVCGFSTDTNFRAQSQMNVNNFLWISRLRSGLLVHLIKTRNGVEIKKSTDKLKTGMYLPDTIPINTLKPTANLTEALFRLSFQKEGNNFLSNTM